MTRLLDWRLEPNLTAASEAIRTGQLVILPTDTCYGVACDAFDADAVARLKSVRGMPPETLVTVLAADMAVVDALVINMSPLARAIAEEFWPGPLSMLLHSRPSLQWGLDALPGSVAIRIPDHSDLRALLRESGPLAVSQASPVGAKPPFTVDDALQALGIQTDMAIEGGVLPRSMLSTFIDCRDGQLDMLRIGAVTAGELLGIAESVKHDPYTATDAIDDDEEDV